MFMIFCLSIYFDTISVYWIFSEVWVKVGIFRFP